MSENLIANELKLPCGAIIKNRICKSAMSENMASRGNIANEALRKLYERWANGGTGLLITGNVMIDRTAKGEPRNVIIEKGKSDEGLKEWAKAGTQNNTHMWMQIITQENNRQNI